MTDDYDPAKDAIGSYYVAIEEKRKRGDTHWPEPLQDRPPEPVQQPLFGESV